MRRAKAKETKVNAKPAKKAANRAAPARVLNGVTPAPREERNGVKRPAPGGLRANVWATLDKVLAGGTEPTTAQMKELAAAKGWNVNNATAELSARRNFNGLSKPRAAKG